MMRRALSSGPLRFRAFRYVWAGESVSMLGDYSFTIAFSWLVLRTTQSPAALAGVLIANGVPRSALMLFSATLVDRLSPRAVMMTSHLVRGLIMAMLVAVIATGHTSLAVFYAISVSFGVADAFFSPASTKLIPDLLPGEDLPRGNALIGIAEQSGRLAGPVLGGLLIGMVTDVAPFAFNAATFFLAAALLTAAPPTRSARRETGRRSFVGDLRDGLSLAARSTEIRIILCLLAASTLTYSGLFGAGLPALARHLNGGAQGLGVLVASWGLGQLAGTLAAAVTGLPNRWGRLMIAVTLVEGASFAVLGVLPSFWLTVGVLFGLGFGVAYVEDVALPTFVQSSTPREFLGRIHSVIELPRVSLEPLSLAITGVMFGISVRWGFFYAALPMIVVGFGLLLSRPARELRQVAPRSCERPDLSPTC